MVTQEPSSRETRVELSQEELAAMPNEAQQAYHRARLIEQGIANGMPKTLEWVLPQEDEDEAPEEREEWLRIAKEAREDLVTEEIDFTEEIDREYPEMKAFFDKMDAYFPNGYRWIHLLDPESTPGRALFSQLKNEFPAAWDFFLAEVD